MSLAKIPPTARQNSILMMHLVAFLVVNAIIWFVWYKGGAGYAWPIWLTSAWFLSLIGHWAALHTRYEDAGMNKYMHDAKN
jgi:2TM domain